LPAPALRGGLLGDFCALLWGQGFGPRLTALLSERYGVLIAAIVLSILDLAGGDIDDQLAELHRVAGAFEATSSQGRYPRISLICFRDASASSRVGYPVPSSRTI